MAEQTYHGGCHCGAIRYSADLDFDNGTYRCNCSLCSKTRAWFAFTPRDKFRLDKDGPTIEYRWTPPGKERSNLAYHICSTCGVRTYTFGDGPGGPQAAIQVATIEDADPDTLLKSIHYIDMAHDRFDREPADKRLL